jgi:hypothetical protein
VADLGEAAAHGSWPAALAALRVEVARITPDAPTPLDTVAALRSLPPDEIARHVAAGRAEADATAHAADARGAAAAPGTESDATSARPTP